MIRFWVADLVARAVVGVFVVSSILGAGSGKSDSGSRDAGHAMNPPAPAPADTASAGIRGAFSTATVAAGGESAAAEDSR